MQLYACKYRLLATYIYPADDLNTQTYHKRCRITQTYYIKFACAYADLVWHAQLEKKKNKTIGKNQSLLNEIEIEIV